MTQATSLKSFDAKLRPETRLILLLVALLTINSHPQLWGPRGAILAVLGLALILGARISARCLGTRLLQLAPFLIMVGLIAPAAMLERQARWNLLARVVLSGLALVIFGLSSDFRQMISGLRRLHLPKPILMILSLMQLFLTTLIREARRIETSRNLRFFGRKYLRQFGVSGKIIGALFLRTYERGERLYAAMTCRGWDGLPPEAFTTLRFQDWLALGMGSAIALLLLWGVK